MGLSRSRTITIVVALATLLSNSLSAVLFAQLPDDPFRLASNFRWYLHFANVLSVFGFIGAIRQNGLSIAIFANYLIFDTILCSVPRFLLLSLLNTFSSTLCSGPSISPFSSQPSSSKTTLPPTSLQTLHNEQSCIHLLQLAQITLAAGVLAATVLQFVGALCVREYARALWVRECREEGILVVEGLREGGYTDEEVLFGRGGATALVVGGDEEVGRKERLVEEWGFGGLPVIEDVEEKV